MLANWVKQTTTTTGTGDLTLSSVSGFPTFNDGFGVGRHFYYTILNDADGTPIESGIGHLSASTTLVRDKVLATFASSTYDNTSPTAISLASGTKRVICAGEASGFAGGAPSFNRNASLGATKYRTSSHVLVHDASSSAVTLTADRLYFVPYLLDCQADVDSIAVRVGTGAAGSSLRLGIYDTDHNGHPGARLGETSALDCSSSSTNLSGSITPIKLTQGWYWLAIVSNGAPVVGRYSYMEQSVIGSQSANLIQTYGYFYASHTFGTLPATGTTTSLSGVTASSSAYLPALFLGLA